MEDNELVKKYVALFAKTIKDPVGFARTFLHFQPYPYQEQFLHDDSPLIAACCGRQVGKTTLAAIKALHFAISNNKVLVVIISAGLRQSIILFDKTVILRRNCRRHFGFRFAGHTCPPQSVTSGDLRRHFGFAFGKNENLILRRDAGCLRLPQSRAAFSLFSSVDLYRLWLKPVLPHSCNQREPPIHHYRNQPNTTDRPAQQPNSQRHTLLFFSCARGWADDELL